MVEGSVTLRSVRQTTVWRILVSTALIATAMNGDDLICYECFDGDCTTFTGDEDYNFGMPTNCTESKDRTDA